MLYSAAPTFYIVSRTVIVAEHVTSCWIWIDTNRYKYECAWFISRPENTPGIV
jgi:hypothetical protein